MGQSYLLRFQTPAGYGCLLWALHVGLDPAQAQSWQQPRVPKTEMRTRAHRVVRRGTSLARGCRPQGFTAGNGALGSVSVFQGCGGGAGGVFITRKQLQRVQILFPRWEWWDLRFYLRPVQRLLVAICISVGNTK